jgi:hypothetical protein
VQHGRGVGDFIYQPCQPEPKMTVRACALSIALATIHAATNSFFGLFTGITVASATPAVVSMAVPHNGGGGILDQHRTYRGPRWHATLIRTDH